MTTEDKVFCPFCSMPLQIRLTDKYRFVPIITRDGVFQVKCRSRTCKDRWVDIDIRRPILIG